MAAVLYLDSSALVKTVVREPESTALRRALRRVRQHATSALAITEVLRAVRRSDPGAVRQAHAALRRLTLLDVTDELLEQAGILDPAELRTLDAIHLTTALRLGPDLAALITYDQRQATAALRLGLPVESPAR